MARVTNWRCGGKGESQTHNWFPQYDIWKGAEEIGQELPEASLNFPTASCWYIEMWTCGVRNLKTKQARDENPREQSIDTEDL